MNKEELLQSSDLKMIAAAIQNKYDAVIETQSVVSEQKYYIGMYTNKDDSQIISASWGTTKAEFLKQIDKAFKRFEKK